MAMPSGQKILKILSNVVFSQYIYFFARSWPKNIRKIAIGLLFKLTLKAFIVLLIPILKTHFILLTALHFIYDKLVCYQKLPLPCRINSGNLQAWRSYTLKDLLKNEQSQKFYNIKISRIIPTPNYSNIGC